MRPETRRSHRIFEHLDRELDTLRERSLHRTLDDGLDFCSNDYLGLATDPAFLETVGNRIRASIESTGTAAATGSRLLSGHGQHWDTLEERFARFADSESALYFGSGYAANLGLITAVAKDGDTIFSDASNHASLIDAIRLSRAGKVVFPHLDLDVLEDNLRKPRENGNRFIVVESVFSMEGDRAPLDDLAALADRYGAGLIVDEAHATGVFGTHGGGLVTREFREGPVVATVSTCGKALAAPGAFVAGKPIIHEYLINRARTFIFSTALPPYAAAHVEVSIEAVAAADEARQRLAGLSATLRRKLAALGVDTGRGDTPIIPVIIGSSREAVRVADGLRARGLHVRPIRPPTVPEGSARLRLSVTARTPETKIDALVDALARSL